MNNLMWRNLWERSCHHNYVVWCFLASGFDTAEVISSMDASEKPGNSISAIVNKYYRGNKEFCCTPAPDDFVFPPGHRIRILNDVKKATRKRTPFTTEKCKSKLRCQLQSTQHDSDADSATQTVSSVSRQIRFNISKWVKHQPDALLRSLQENKLLLPGFPSQRLFLPPLNVMHVPISYVYSPRKGLTSYLTGPSMLKEIRSCMKSL